MSKSHTILLKCVYFKLEQSKNVHTIPPPPPSLSIISVLIVCQTLQVLSCFVWAVMFLLVIPRLVIIFLDLVCYLIKSSIPSYNPGVLKDYLRELPEPLFTNALYQMLLDALSVRLPSDPDGSAKLMLSILECLPKANQVRKVNFFNLIRSLFIKASVHWLHSATIYYLYCPHITIALLHGVRTRTLSYADKVS